MAISQYLTCNDPGLEILQQSEMLAASPEDQSSVLSTPVKWFTHADNSRGSNALLAFESFSKQASKEARMQASTHARTHARTHACTCTHTHTSEAHVDFGMALPVPQPQFLPHGRKSMRKAKLTSTADPT